jgi:Tfp pilus assembly major pilin PilA
MRSFFKCKSFFSHRIIRKRSGFTIVELVTIVVLITVLATLSIFFYYNHLNKAKIIIAQSTIDNVRKTLEVFNMDRGNYPVSIDFNNCVDEQGRSVFDPSLCDQVKSDIFSVESYSRDGLNYILKVRAKDTEHTLITIEDNKISIQGK